MPRCVSEKLAVRSGFQIQCRTEIDEREGPCAALEGRLLLDAGQWRPRRGAMKQGSNFILARNTRVRRKNMNGKEYIQEAKVQEVDSRLERPESTMEAYED